MATSSKNNVSLVIEAGVTGEASVRRMADEVRRLAKEGGDAAPEFQALAAQLDGIAAQSGAAATVAGLTAEVAGLTAEQTKARAASEGVSAALAEQTAKTTALRATQTGLKDDIGAARLEVVKAENAIREYTNEFDAAGKKTAVYRSGLSDLQATLSRTREQLVQKRVALEQLTPAVNEAAAVEKKLQGQYDALNTSAERSAQALRQRTVALADAEASAQALGVGTDDLVASENVLLAATQRVAIETNNLATQRREAAAAATTLAELDRQNAAVLEQQQARLFAIVEAYEREQAALVEAAAAAKAKRLADYEAIEAAAARSAASRLTAEALAAERAASVAAALETKRLATEADAAEADFKALAAAEREAAEAAEALSAAEGVASVKKLEAAAREADAEIRDLTASLRGAEAAAVEFAASTERAAAAGQDDIATTQARRRAAEQLIEAERSLTVAQAELARQRDGNRAGLLLEAQALLGTARAADASREATQRLVQQAQSAANILTTAFGQTGVRSMQAIEAEIAQVERSLSLLERQARAGAVSADDLARATGSAAVRLATLKREIETIPNLPGTFERLNSQVNDLIGRFGSLTAAFATVAVAVKPFLDAAIALDQIRRVLTTVTGSAESAQRQIGFLRDVAQQSGQAFSDIGASYAKFAASALQSGVSLKDTQEVFRSVSLAAGNLGLSSDQAKRALEALSQIASKGVVSMEELRQQLGDALPGVLPALARELGLTQAELNKVVESGQLLASEAIPAIGRSLASLQPSGSGGVSGLVSEFNRLKNVVLEAGTAFTDGPFGFAIGVSLKLIAVLIGGIAVGVATISEAFRLAGVTIYETLQLAVTRDLAGFKKAIGEATDESVTRLADLSRRFAGTGEAASGAIPSIDKLGQSFAKLSLEQQKSIDAAELRSRTSETLAQAAEKEAEAIAQVVAIVGSEQEAASRALESANRVAAAREEAAAAAHREVEALTAAKTAAIDKAGSDEAAVAGIKAYVEALDKKIEKADADAVKSDATADKARRVAEAAALAAAKIGDQSGQIATLTIAVDDASRALVALQSAYRVGLATQDDVLKADRALAEAKAKLRDAVNDQVAASERLIAGLKAEADFTKALLELDIAKLKVKRDDALQRGAEIQARQLSIQIADLELQVTKTSTLAKRAEANEIIRTLTLRKQELATLGQLTPEIAADINLRIRRAQILTIEADTTNVATAAQDKHLTAVRNGIESLDSNTSSTSSNTSAVSSGTSAIDSNTSSREKNAKATASQSDAQKRYNELLRDDPSRLVGGSGLAGITSSGPGSSSTSGNGGSGASPYGPYGTSTGGSGVRPASAGTSSAGGTQYDENGFAIGVGGSFQVPMPPGFYHTQDPYAYGAAPAGYAPNGQPYGGYIAPIPGYQFPAPAATEASAPAPAPALAPSSSNRTVTVRLQLAGGTYAMQSDETTAQALLAALERAQAQQGG